MFNQVVIAEDLYQYTDKSGNLVITNKKTAGSRRFFLGTNENTRHKILEEELKHEQDAIKLINTVPQKNVAVYNNDIMLHQKNIEVLTRQLNED